MEGESEGYRSRELDNLPPLLTSEETAGLFRVSRKQVQNNPLMFGGKKIRGVGWRFPRNAVLGIAGLARDKREEKKK